MSRRRKAREIALQTLYAAEIGEAEWKDALADSIRRRRASDEASEYAGRLVGGVSGSRERLDGMISSSLENWKLKRVAAVDRIIMEIALYELLECPEVPTGVIIDEAIEIAHRFSSEKAGSFVNGILDKLSGEVRSG
jgi:transcription antitermination protein NusB